MFKKEDKKDPSAKGADVLSATPTLARPVRRNFEAAQFQAQGKLPQIRIARWKSGSLFQGVQKQANAEIRSVIFTEACRTQVTKVWRLLSRI